MFIFTLKSEILNFILLKPSHREDKRGFTICASSRIEENNQQFEEETILVNHIFIVSMSSNVRGLRKESFYHSLTLMANSVQLTNR